MEFCEKCGGMILIKEGKVVCASCGTRIKKKLKLAASEKIAQHETIVIVNEDADTIYPLVDMICPECKNKKAYFWTSQTRAADESETKFYKCAKCKHTWREYR